MVLIKANLFIEDILVVDDDSEAEEDPDCNIGVSEKDSLDDAVAQRPALSHDSFGFVEIPRW